MKNFKTPLKVGEKYKTHKGEIVEILCNDIDQETGDSGIKLCVGLIRRKGFPFVWFWTEEGEGCGGSNFCIVEEYKEPLQFEFDWSIIPPWFNYIIKTQDGFWFVLENRPPLGEICWMDGGGIFSKIPPSHEPKGEFFWKNSLHQRPDADAQ